MDGILGTDRRKWLELNAEVSLVPMPVRRLADYLVGLAARAKGSFCRGIVGSVPEGLSRQRVSRDSNAEAAELSSAAYGRLHRASC